MGLEIILDKYRIHGGEAEYVVEDTRDYLAVRRWLASFDGRLPDGTIVVTRPAFAGWFDDVATQGHVNQKVLDPRKELRQLLCVNSLPDLIEEDPGAIVEAGLLTAARSLPRAVNEDVECWLARVLLDVPWNLSELSDISDLNAILCDCSNINGSESPLHHALRRRRLSMWAAENTPWASVFRWLSAEPQSRAAALLIAEMIHSYPHELIEEVMTSASLWEDLCRLQNWHSLAARIGRRSGPPQSDLPHPATSVVKRFLSEVLCADGGLEEAAGVISGRLTIEVNTFVEHLRERAEQGRALSRTEGQAIRDTFAANEEAKHLISLVDQLIERPTARPVASDASWSDVRQWLRDSYLPFYSQRALVGDLAETVDCVRSFEDWLLSNYWELSRSDDCLSVSFADEVKAAVSEAPVLIAVIDGVGAQWTSMLGTLFSNAGLSQRREPSLLLAPIPTITRLTKPALLGGQFPSQLHEDAANLEVYRDLLATGLGCEADDIAVGSDRETDVHSVVQQGSRITLFLYNRIDADALHMAIPEFRRRAKIERELSTIAEDLCEAANLMTRTTSATAAPAVFVIADHGYSVLSDTIGRSVEVPEGVDSCHGRVAMGRIAAAGCDGAVELEGEEYMLPHDVTVARGYNYIGSRPRGAVHGGLTPQEVAVPVFALSTEPPAAVAGLLVELKGEVQRKQSENTISAVLYNPNDRAAKVYGLNLRLTKTVSTLPITIEPGGTEEIELSVDASEARSETLELSGTVAFEVLGQQGSVIVTETVATTGAAVTDTAFEDMFDDA